MAKQPLKKGSAGFALIKNAVAQDGNLSFKARGLFTYLYSKPDDWDFAVERIVRANPKDKKASVNSGLKELEKAGYLRRERLHTGKVEYHINYEPFAENQQEASEPVAEKATVGKSHSGKIGHITNKEDSTKTEENTNIISENEKLIPEVIDLFKNLNPAYQRLFGRVNQRESCQRMLETHGFEKIQFAIKYLEHCVSTGNRYCPIITTPLELEDKWGKLQIAYSKEKVGTQKGGVYKI